MRLLTVFCILLTGACVMFTGCAGKEEKMQGTPIDFTVVSDDEVPKELQEILNLNKESEMMLSYKLEDYYYLVRGYGEQKSGGYSITVERVCLSDDGIHMETHLIGPPLGEEIAKEPSYPYVVVKIEYMEKAVIFE